MNREVQTARAAKRIMSEIETRWAGNIRAAAADLAVSYTVLWRAATGNAQRGPSMDVIEALVRCSDKPMGHWTGRDK